LSLILSDVIGDPLDTIASGPTAPDSTLFKNAQSVLKKYKLWDDCTEAIRNRIEAGIQGELDETPKADDPIFERVTNVIVANNRVACNAAVKKAEELGYLPLILTTYLEGEAREIGTLVGGLVKETAFNGNPVDPPAALILGGETTVKVLGDGAGGRNLELALSAAITIDGIECLVGSFATDGADGSSGTAGAVVDGSTLNRARKAKLEPEKYLDKNDSASFFNTLGDSVITGLTGTNVNDVVVVLVP
jgi:glycerate-2-kinase